MVHLLVCNFFSACIELSEFSRSRKRGISFLRLLRSSTS
uniref:Uncharacterized protein n=1 Tax=Arundo donax TaxID=35708 RepID=A0A0A9EGC2_ARUDO